MSAMEPGAINASSTPGFPQPALRRLQAQMPRMSQQMMDAILAEVPRYSAAPAAYRTAVLQRCRLATRLFLRILASGRPPGPRDIRVVQAIARDVALVGEPLEPLLHALRIGARVGWDQTLRVSLVDPDVSPRSLLPLAGQVFEYIDQLSSRIAEAYAQQVEEIARQQAFSESAMFEDLLGGRVEGGPAPLAPPRVALAVASASAAAAETTAGRLRTRLPTAVVGQRRGLSIWLVEREPLPSLLADCAGEDAVVFGVGSAGDNVPLERAAQEAALAAGLALELGLGEGRPRVFDFPQVFAYASARSDPEALARCQAALLGPVLDKPVLLTTLRHYFATGRSISRTAAAVHRHRQSVIYRMRQVAGLLGVSLDDAEAMFRIEAAVRTLPAS